jgi:hypothetical protein
MPETTTTQVIECDCSVCQGRKAEVRGSERYSSTAVHNIVQLAHSPLARAASAKQFGPWAR